MCSLLLLFCFCEFFALSVVHSKAPPFITPCKAGDNECMIHSFQSAIPVFSDGDPNIGLKPIDPLYFDEIKSDLPGLESKIEDVNVIGFKTCKVLKAIRDTAKQKLIGEIKCNMVIDAKYKIKGRLLLLPIEGQGKLKAIFNNIILKSTADMLVKKGKDGKDHWHIKKFGYGFEFTEKADFQLENLLQGSDVIGNLTENFLSENSNDVAREIGDPLIQATMKKVIENVNRFFSKFSIDDLTLDNK